jgi:1-acyl-sn-glycerol-3-phosphate acyltransferase
MRAFTERLLLSVYSLWAYLVFFALLPPAALAYAVLAVLGPDRGREKRMLRVNRVVAWLWGACCGIRFEMEKHPALSNEGVYVFTPNHSSTLDMLTGSFALRHGMRFLVKKELRRIPFLGFMFGLMGIFVERSDPQSRKKSRETLRSWAARGVSFCVFPEGTRNRSTHPLGRFYDGAFDAAISAGIPVAPVVFIGGRRLMPMNSRLIRPGRLRAIFLEPVSTAGLGLDAIQALREQVYRRMHNALVRFDPDFSRYALLGPEDPLPEWAQPRTTS